MKMRSLLMMGALGLWMAAPAMAQNTDPQGPGMGRGPGFQGQQPGQGQGKGPHGHKGKRGRRGPGKKMKGPIVHQSTKGFDQTVAALTQAFEQKGMTIFAVIDHQAAAQKAGLEMQKAKVIIFGAPKAGTPLMVKDPLFALKLPLKVLVTEMPNGEVVVAHAKIKGMIKRSRLAPEDVAGSLGKVPMLIRAAIQ